MLFVWPLRPQMAVVICCILLSQWKLFKLCLFVVGGGGGCSKRSAANFVKFFDSNAIQSRRRRRMLSLTEWVVRQASFELRAFECVWLCAFFQNACLLALLPVHFCFFIFIFFYYVLGNCAKRANFRRKLRKQQLHKLNDPFNKISKYFFCMCVLVDCCCCLLKLLFKWNVENEDKAVDEEKQLQQLPLRRSFNGHQVPTKNTYAIDFLCNNFYSLFFNSLFFCNFSCSEFCFFLSFSLLFTSFFLSYCTLHADSLKL